MLRTVVVRTAVAGAAVMAVGAGVFAVAAGDPVRHGSPTAPPAQACGGSAEVRCVASTIAWNSTGLVIRIR